MPQMAAAAVQHDYTVTVDADLSRLTVEAEFSEPVRGLAARSRDARHFLRMPRDCERDQRLRHRGRRLITPDAGVRCLAYAVDLARTARVSRTGRLLDPSNIAVSPALWMWQPELDGDDAIRVRFLLPDDMRVSVPWPALPGEENTFLLSTSPESGNALAVFGDFDRRNVTVAGADLEITLLRTASRIDFDEIVKWIRDTANNIALAYGRFPSPSTRVVLIPVGGNPSGGDAAVPFGRVVRDGGETIELLINEHRPITEYYDEWTPTHEFSHLMLPYLRHSRRWISEGFASYYQNVLLARAGRYSEEDAWSKLAAGFDRGRDSVPTLSPNAAASGSERNTRMKVYWSGAALALIADVELRRRSGGAESLDIVLGRLQQCCLPSGRSWSGRELFAKLDTLLDEPLFMDLYRRYADTAGFPDVEPLLERLGIRARADGVSLSDRAELASIRVAITAPY